MQNFALYITKLFIVCTASYMCELICKNTADPKSTVSTAVKLICSLCICITVFSIFFSGDKILNDFGNLADYSENIVNNPFSEDTVIENTKTTLEHNLSDAIFESFGIKPVSVCIEFIIKRNNNITDVTLSEADIILPEENDKNLLASVKNYLEGALGCPVTVRSK